MEASRAVSSGVDRTIKIWDLGRGFCKNGFLCAQATHDCVTEHICHIFASNCGHKIK